MKFVSRFVVVAATFGIAACGAAVESSEYDDTGSTTAALEVAGDTTLMCGVDGRIVYEYDCDDLQAKCQGDFICADEYPSRDGSCATWGACVDDGSEKAAAKSNAASVTYGPVITVKPKG